MDLARKDTWCFETDDHSFNLFSRSGGLCHGSGGCGGISEVSPTGDLQKKGGLLDTPTRSATGACGVNSRRGYGCRTKMIIDYSGVSGISVIVQLTQI